MYIGVLVRRQYGQQHRYIQVVGPSKLGEVFGVGQKLKPEMWNMNPSMLQNPTVREPALAVLSTLI